MGSKGGECTAVQGGTGRTNGQKLTLARLNDWLAKAQPGARLCYGHGDHASHIASDEVNLTLRSLAERNFLFLCQGPRDVYGRDYLAIRSSRPVQGDRA